MLVGPPGTGKTLLAKAVAGEAQVPFFLCPAPISLRCLGVGASRVRDLSVRPKKSNVLFSLMKLMQSEESRGKSPSFSANDERGKYTQPITHRNGWFRKQLRCDHSCRYQQADILDRALLRPGRFDRQIYVELPDVNGRKAIFLVHLKPLKINDTLDVDFLARQTPGSPVPILLMCNEAALIAARKTKPASTNRIFLMRSTESSVDWKEK